MKITNDIRMMLGMVMIYIAVLAFSRIEPDAFSGTKFAVAVLSWAIVTLVCTSITSPPAAVAFASALAQFSRYFLAFAVAQFAVIAVADAVAHWHASVVELIIAGVATLCLGIAALLPVATKLGLFACTCGAPDCLACLLSSASTTSR
jgi:hypothetical protein